MIRRTIKKQKMRQKSKAVRANASFVQLVSSTIHYSVIDVNKNTSGQLCVSAFNRKKRSNIFES